MITFVNCCAVFLRGTDHSSLDVSPAIIRTGEFLSTLEIAAVEICQRVVCPELMILYTRSHEHACTI
jgi:hypothetical protein